MDTKTHFRQMTFQEIDLPEVVYKYRDWSKEEHKRILTDNEVYFAQPQNFDDHLECNLPTRFDLFPDNDWIRFLYNDIRNKNPQLTEDCIHKIVFDCMKKNNIRDSFYQKKVERGNYELLNKEVGFLSLTTINNSKMMWSKYGGQNNGICVGFHSKLMFNDNEHFGAGGAVTYYDENEPPILLPFYFTDEEIVNSYLIQVFSLKKKWKNQNEYRLAKLYIRDRRVKIRVEAYKEIILRHNMPNKDKQEVLKIAKERFPHVQIYKARYDEKTKSLVNVLI